MAYRNNSGNYKCVVSIDGESSEAGFKVTLPINHEDLIERKESDVVGLKRTRREQVAEQDNSDVTFSEGDTLTMEVQ